MPEKTLALPCKYFGDAVLMTSALRALRAHFADAQIHVVVPEEAAPLLRQLTWLDRVWTMPRRREIWPLISLLRREQFDRLVDFASNDLGAILSLLIGAKIRLSWDESGGFLGQGFCFSVRVPAQAINQYEGERLAKLLSGWQLPPP